MKIKINKKFILANLPYLMFFWMADKIAYAVRTADSNKLFAAVNGVSELLQAPILSLHITDLLIGALGALAVKGVLYLRSKNAKKYRKGVEYGSARWGTADDIKPYIDSNFQNNILLTNTERLTMNSRPKNPNYAKNKNVLVIGGSGSGKTRFFIKPNLMQLHSSYVVTDPKGTILIECGKLLQRGGYQIKVLNTINFKKSMHYNPLEYIHNEQDILKLVNVLIANTSGSKEKSGEDFWVKSERLLYSAYIAYIWYEAPEEEKNLLTLLDMINASEAREDDENFKSPVDMLFERLAEKDPEHFAVRQYHKFKLAAGKTLKSILVSCGARLAPFDIKEVRNMTAYDDLELNTMGDKKTALFIITSDTDSTFDFITAMVVSQLFNILCTKADDEYGGRLPFHVRCLLDEVANITIPDLQRLLSVIRSREISACLVVQAQSQLKAIYKDNSETIMSNCDSMLFLGGKEKSTLKEISETLGKETIDMYYTSETKSNQNSHSINYQKLGKALMSEDELAVMDGGKCILQIRGVRPFFSNKYDITAHPNYKYLSDFDPKNTFDIEKYMKQQKPIVKKNEVFDYYKIDLLPDKISGSKNLKKETEEN